MEQTALDMDMLPEWVQSGVYTAPFLEWLLKADNLPWDEPEFIVVKVKQKNFIFLYLARKKGNQVLRLKSGLEFAGLFCRSNYELYDVQDFLRTGLGISEDVTFQNKEETVERMEQEVQKKILDLIANHWDLVLSEKKYETRQLLPALKREEVRSMAEHFYLDGVPADEVVYRPRFALSGDIPDSYYLLYLEHGVQTVNALAMHWIRKRVPALSKQRILYGCVREEMHQIPAEGRLSKIRQMRETLAGVDEETVLVEFRKEGKVACIRMKASDLMEPQGRYPLACMAARERAQLKKVYGKSASAGLQVDDIQSVTWNRKILYAADEKQEAA